MKNRFWMLSSAAVFAVAVAVTSSSCSAASGHGFTMGPPTWALSHIASSVAAGQPAMALHNNAAPSFTFHPMPVTTVPTSGGAGTFHMSTTSVPVTTVPTNSGAGTYHMSTTSGPVTNVPTSSGAGTFHMSTTSGSVTSVPTSSGVGTFHMSTTVMPTSASYSRSH